MSAPAPDWMAAVMRAWRSGVDGLEHAFGSEGFGGLGHLALQLHVRFGDEVDPAYPVDLGALSEGGRSAGGQYALDSARDADRHARSLDEGSAIHVIAVRRFV